MQKLDNARVGFPVYMLKLIDWIERLPQPTSADTWASVNNNDFQLSTLCHSFICSHFGIGVKFNNKMLSKFVLV